MGLAGAWSAIGFVLPKRLLRPDDVGKNQRPLKLQDYSIWLRFRKHGFPCDKPPIGFVFPKCSLSPAMLESGLFCQNSHEIPSPTGQPKR